MASRRYVRDGSNRSSHQNPSQLSSSGGRWASGRGRARGRGRFSGRCHGTSGNKWVRGSGLTVTDRSKSNSEDTEVCFVNGASTNKNETTAKYERPAEDHHSEPRFERRGKYKLSLITAISPNHREAINTVTAGDISARNLNISSSDFRVDNCAITELTSSVHVEKSKTTHQEENKEFDESIEYQSDSLDVAPNDNSIYKTVAENVIEENKKVNALSKPASLERRGQNKLVLPKQDAPEQVSDGSNTTRHNDSSTASRTCAIQSFTWSRQPVKQPRVDETSQGRKSCLIRDHGWSYTDATDGVKKRKWQETQQKNQKTGSRRILLAANTSTARTLKPKLIDEASTNNQTAITNASTLKSVPVPAPNKKFTDYAYRNIGRSSSTERFRQNSVNMGLIRVQPDSSTTPICPTFRRGIPCNNPACILRHDVSFEASRPICSFFQRNGMCSKGDECVFRHVKVRWDAKVCPMFERLGYCEDADCNLRHVVTTKKSKGRSGASKSDT